MSWDPINLAKIEERPPLTPSLGDVGLVYPTKRHVFSGPPESAKTLAAYEIALAEIRSGGVVILIDFEMGRYDARDRLRELGATDDDLERLLYVEPETPATEEIMRDLLVWKPTLVIVDASAGAYDLQGLDDNKRRDVETFAKVWVTIFHQADVATLLIDHVTKNAESRGQFAIGSERKVGGTDVHLGFEVVQPIRRGGHGIYRVMVRKDRFGHLHRPKAAEFLLASDPESHALSAMFVLETSDQAEEQWRPTHLMQKVSEWLEQQSEPASRNQVEASVRGKRDYVRAALDALVRDGYATETQGRGNARLYAHKQPYREEAPTVTGAGNSPPRPGFAPGSPRANPSAPRPASPHPHGGARGEGESADDPQQRFAPAPAGRTEGVPPAPAEPRLASSEPSSSSPSTDPAPLLPGAAKAVRDAYRRDGATRAEIAEAYGLPLAVVEQLLAENGTA